MMIQPVQQQLTGSQYCSYRAGGPLDEPYIPTTLDDAVAVLDMVASSGKKLTVIGGGCNTLIASQGIRGVTLIVKRLHFVDDLGDNTFRMGAGMNLAKVSTLAQEKGLTGVEFMIGVPGTLGGAVAMNAGAMGQETSETVQSAVVYNLETGQVEEWDRSRLDFSYRHSGIVPGKHIVLAAVLKLQPGEPAQIDDLIKKSIAFRQKHHPKEPNCGSVFKNPALDKPVGRLLDEAGAKGYRVGGAMISPLHANFIINVDRATSTDILSVMMAMKRIVKEQYGLDIYPENRFVGDATPEEIAMWEELTGYAWKD